MDFPLSITSFLASTLGFLVGGIVAWFFNFVLNKSTYTFFAICSGLIFGVILLDVFPKTISLGGVYPTLIGLWIGFICYLFIHFQDKKLKNLMANEKSPFFHTAIIFSISIALHNIPTGISIGAVESQDFQQSLLLTLFFHSIPEGIVVSTPLLLSGYGAVSIVLVAILVSLPVGISVFFGIKLDYISPIALSTIMGLAMGVILLVTWKEILGKTFEKKGAFTAISYFSIGIFIIILYKLILEASLQK